MKRNEARERLAAWLDCCQTCRFNTLYLNGIGSHCCNQHARVCDTPRLYNVDVFCAAIWVDANGQAAVWGNWYDDAAAVPRCPNYERRP